MTIIVWGDGYNHKTIFLYCRNNGKPCPLEDCHSLVRNLPRHLELVHCWPANKARNALNVYGLRKNYTFKDPERKAKIKPDVPENAIDDSKKCKKETKDTKFYINYHKLRMCPILGCRSTNKRMPAHLREVHKIEKGTPMYYHLLKEAKPHVHRTPPVSKKHYEENPGEELVCTESVSSLNLCREEANEDRVSEEGDSIPDIWERFINYKISVDGGNGNYKAACQSKQELISIMKSLQSSDIKVLFSKHKLRDIFLHQYAEKEKGYKALTIKRYLLSLIHFYDFTLSEEIVVNDVSPENILRMKVIVSRWSKAYNGQAEKQQLLREMDEQSVLITPEQIQRYHNSECAREAREILCRVQGPFWTNSLSRLEYTCVRDHLLTEIEIVSCHRSGVSSNMTVSEVENATVRDEKHIIKVKKHKTFKKHGPALLCVEDEFYQQLIVFITKIRGEIQAALDNVFLSFYGQVLSSGAISKQINSIWQRAGVYGDNKPPVKKNISSNIFRKSGSTIIEDQAPEGARYVASLLTHSEATSMKHYRLTEKEKFALKGTEVLAKIFSKRKVEFSDVAPPPKMQRLIWTDDLVEEMKDIFSSNIIAKKISMENVRDAQSSNEILSELKERQILDKVRSFWRYCSDKGMYDGIYF